jgi:DNA-binding FadR family transcriptional regulator
MNATPTDAHGLERCLKAMTRDVETGRDDFKREIDFHLGVAEATHNRVRLFITTSLLLAHLEELRRIRHEMIHRRRQVIEDILREHEAIFTAIKDRNPAKAREAMKAHHDAAYDRMSPAAEWMISGVEAFKPPSPSREPKPPRRFPERRMRATVKR